MVWEYVYGLKLIDWFMVFGLFVNVIMVVDLFMVVWLWKVKDKAKDKTEDRRQMLTT